MEPKHILGLDLGTNSIGWAVINASKNEENKEQLDGINCDGVRIIPMDAAVLGDFDKGNSKSQTADRTKYRSMRRLYERCHLRRERLHRVLALLNFLPSHYSRQLDRYGKFIAASEPKLLWCKDEQGRWSFIFQESFDEMLADFYQNQPGLLSEGQKVPYDWTIYYLRKKALTKKIRKEELAWILLNFNQKRGYYQLRGEEEQERPSKTRQYFDSQVVTNIIDTNQTDKGKKVFSVILENGMKGKISTKEVPDWIGQKKNIIVIVDLDKDGNDKYDEAGELSCRFKIPTEKEWEEQWELIKAKTQNDLDTSGKTVGAYIYDTLLQTPKQKIRGKLVRTIERRYYKDELRQILAKQKEFHPELRDRALYEACLEELYPQNDAHRNLIANRDLIYLLVDDILFYQRPLKSKKSLIADCPYEEYIHTDKHTGEIQHFGIKCIAKSHPLFQEFRLWQFLSNLRIYQKEKTVEGKLYLDVDVTSEFLKDEEDYADLFDWLNQQKSIKQDTFLKCPLFGLKKNDMANYRWNYVEDKPYPGNETRALILGRLEKAGIPADFLTRKKEEALWHILYSVSDKEELGKALISFAEKQQLGENFVEVFLKTPPFDKEYGSYSAKAVKKLLPLMRMGKYWNENDIDGQTRDRIDKIISGEYDEAIRTHVREKAIHLDKVSSFKGLPLWLACYVVYNRHSEAKDIQKWENPSDIDDYLKRFKQHSLHNPIVEQVILETLRTVRDIWKQVGHIDEIHVELGREMKKTKDERAKMTRQIQENENTNLRIKALLTEFMNPEFEIENVRPYSPGQQDLLRIYEEGVWNSVDEVPDEIATIIKKFNESDVRKRPTTSEVLRYKLWLEQKYRSPYTGEMIPLGKLFTPAYEIEHIIPQARYFDDSFSNKVICEAEVNKLKSNMLGYEFIRKNQGRKVEISFGRAPVEIQTIEAYEQFVKDNYSHNSAKKKKLLMEDIPEQFIARQLNDSRYISRLVKSLLSNIVREEGEQEEVSKNVIVCTGSVTDRLKKDWGINEVWNKIILPRFLRLNELTESNRFTSVNTSGNVIPAMPLELQKGFSKKRIDHRHHAMDAIVIACANRNIVNYLNNESASKDAKISRHDLQRLLCDKQKTDDKGNYRWFIKKPWDTFTQDVYKALQDIVVSFKQNLRVINKTTNYYQHYKDGKKTMLPQKKGDSWAIRKPMHKETVFGEVNLRGITTVTLKEALKNPKVIVEKDLKKKLKELLKQNLNEKQIKKYFEDNKYVWQDVDLKKIKVYYFSKDTKDRFFAVRKPLDTAFDKKKIMGSVTDTGIQKILLRHLEANGNDAELAFSPEGVEAMNKNIVALNDGKWHQPIYKVRVYEKADKFAVGQTGNKSAKYVEAAKGTNLFFAIYETEVEDKNTREIIKKRSYATIPLNVVIDRQKCGLPSAPEDENGNLPKFVLSPNDLVYVPTKEEIQNGNTIPLDKTRIYKMVSCTGNQCFFIQFHVANVIVDKYEYSAMNKMERAITGEMIKEICIPIQIDRLGNIIKKI
ncbi:HNH endonuclease domain-containing protein [Bacteroides gallinaceum]|uniref:type II CRISPR RNA-guided endonuclease Cas9 n=1 Tax=Bacteroides gallinaceum TaxID=1462571 RepID=UPI0025A4818D|nr:type II CRISPR RNA-guided endonuclease Cas9 [Bacteroides gallinaceum]MDM8155871.1 HNH endonuclease domain-containing protein [Bacteroides gallinaceum]